MNKTMGISANRPGSPGLNYRCSISFFLLCLSSVLVSLPLMAGSNEAPAVSVGEDRSLLLPADTLCLTGTANDDGMPGTLSVNWLQQSGPETVVLENPAAYDTTALFPAAGNYTLAFQASDGELTATDSLQVTVGRRINVPGDAATVQAAVDLADNGDVIVLAPGIYTGTVLIQDKAVTITSHFYDTGDPSIVDQTVLDGAGADAVVTVGPDIPGMTNFIGITIRDGDDGISGFSPLSVLSCRITDTADAIDYESGAFGGVVRGSLIDHNQDDAVDFDGSSWGIIERNWLANNDDDGIEIRLPPRSEAETVRYIIRDNIITGNREDGIQIIGHSSGNSSRELLIHGNLIGDNTDAGLSLMCCSQTVEQFEGAALPEFMLIHNNTFRDNNHGIIGGDNIVALNNIFVGHDVAMKRLQADSIATHNLLFDNNTDFLAVNVLPDSHSYFDPLLASDGTLQTGSPAIDAGVSSFDWNGATVLDLSFPDDYAGAAPDLGAFESPLNEAPSVDAGEDLLLSWSANPVALSGLVTDDGLPETPGVLSIGWKQLSGPCGVLFEDATAAATSATFAQSGRYGFRLSAHDGEFISSDTVSIDLLADDLPNQPPVANDDSSGTYEETAVSMVVTANDTDPDGNLDPTSANTGCATCSLPANGTLQNHGDGSFTYTPNAGFSGTDGFIYEVCDAGSLCDTANVTLTVSGTTGSTEIAVRVVNGNDDAEEKVSNGKVFLVNNDLELVDDTQKNTAQVVGIRFADVPVPNGVYIEAAHVQFQADEASTGPVKLLVAVEKSDDATAFANTRGDISSRTTTAPVDWSPPDWMAAGDAGAAQRTPDLAGLIQQIVDRPGWNAGNAMAFVFTGSGKRTAESCNSHADTAPVLHIRYRTDTGN
jgi:hypothetical protein